MQPQPFFKAFVHAANGIIHFFRYDRNGKVHLAAAIGVIMAGWYWEVAAMEWCVLILCISTVLGFEMINHAMEKLCNLVHQEWHPVIKVVKDVCAGAVFVAAIVSAVIGSIIFIPKII